jgi:hypothetical protein
VNRVATIMRTVMRSTTALFLLALVLVGCGSSEQIAGDPGGLKYARAIYKQAGGLITRAVDARDVNCGTVKGRPRTQFFCIVNLAGGRGSMEVMVTVHDHFSSFTVDRCHQISKFEVCGELAKVGQE